MRLLRRNRPAQAPAPRDPTAPRPDPRIWGQHYTGRGPVPVGIVMVILLAIASYLAYTKELPFGDDGYRLTATFENAATLRSTAPVRIAGVNVGEVTDVELEGDAAAVTFTVDDAGRPIREDATIEIRPRLFLEGNFFLELTPGSPSAPELPDDGTIPVTQTSTAVQLDQVLAALNGDIRLNLRRLLEGYGTALTHKPTAAEDRTQDPASRGETAAESLNDSFRYGAEAGRGAAIVNDALIGERPGDLAGLIEAQADVFEQLALRESELQGLITNFNITTGALAIEQENLRRSIAELAPTLEEAQPALRNLSDALPPLRALALALEPSLRELPATIEAGFPWLDQARGLLRNSELGGTARILAGATPDLADTASAAGGLFDEIGLISRCATDVLEPTGNLVIDDDVSSVLPGTDFSTGQPNFYEFMFSLVQQTGETQNFDGNGRYLRFQTGGGDDLVQTDQPGGGFLNTRNYGNAFEVPAGVRPVVNGDLPPFRMDVNCHTNALPAVNGPEAAIGPPSPRAAP
jgi:phospholipid/cholesterol/gamma-HCH transport system substrate-binding protein